VAKQRRAAKKTSAKSTRRVKRPATPRKAAARKTTPRARPKRQAAPASRQATAATPAPAAAPAPARKPGFYEAVAVYERGVQGLQRHDFEGAAVFFRTVLERYPEERELLERARLFLRVCERETSRQPPVPKTAAERVYLATVALNSGDHAGALDHLQRALVEDPDSDHAHYIMAVALGTRNADEALEHLQQAIALNPDNRSMARQDPDLDSLRDHSRFKNALDTPPAANRRRATRRR
jgi:tetratricopeptide (TPR) repeat protein